MGSLLRFFSFHYAASDCSFCGFFSLFASGRVFSKKRANQLKSEHKNTKKRKNPEKTLKWQNGKSLN